MKVVVASSLLWAAASTTMTEAACPADGDTFSFQGPCNEDRIATEFATAFADCPLEDAGLTGDDIVCPETAFLDVTYEAGVGPNLARHYQFQKNYMDGATEYNVQDESDSPLTTDAGVIGRAHTNIASQTLLGWPEYEALREYANGPGYMSNFNLTDDGCDLRTVMCCFTDSRLDDSPLVGNTDICHHDISSSKRSNHLDNGWAVFNGAESTDTYCQGFSWSSDEESISNRFKGNALFYASLFTTFDKGFVRNIPGAPMCACIEQMPVVTEADCLDVEVTTDTYVFMYVSETEQIPNEDGTTTPGESVTRLDGAHDAAVSTTECAVDDLLDNFKTNYADTEEEKAEMSDHLLGSGNCDTEAYLNERFFVPGSPEDPCGVDPAEWTKFVGEGYHYQPMIGEDAFRDLYEASSTKIIYRCCTSCWRGTHKHIYYKRFTEYPAELDFLDLLMNEWTNTSNVLQEDMCLYSNLEDALAGQVTPPDANGTIVATNDCWEFCNYNDEGIGFPRDCGPESQNTDQWNSYAPTRQHGSANHHAFYISK